MKRTSTPGRSGLVSAEVAERREARSWIERQLRWERTLGALRRQTDPVPAEQAA